MVTTNARETLTASPSWQEFVTKAENYSIDDWLELMRGVSEVAVDLVAEKIGPVTNDVVFIRNQAILSFRDSGGMNQDAKFIAVALSVSESAKRLLRRAMAKRDVLYQELPQA